MNDNWFDEVRSDIDRQRKRIDEADNENWHVDTRRTLILLVVMFFAALAIWGAAIASVLIWCLS